METQQVDRWFAKCAMPGCKSFQFSEGEKQHPPCGHGSTRFKRVTGTYSASRRCDGRCLNARGPHCECKCAGRNHGAGWMPRAA